MCLDDINFFFVEAFSGPQLRQSIRDVPEGMRRDLQELSQHCISTRPKHTANASIWRPGAWQISYYPCIVELGAVGSIVA